MKKQGFRFALCLVAVLTALCLFVLPGKAEAATVESGACGEGLTWTLDDAGTLTISGIGDMSAWNSTGSDAPWYGMNVKTIMIGGEVTSISDYAFYNCDSVTEVSLGVSTVIDDDDDDDSTIDFDSLIGMITTSKPITIGHAAFFGCDSLTSVSIPSRVTSIGDAAFAGCSNLTTIGVDANHTAYAADDNGVLYSKDMTKLIQAPGAISGSYTIPDNVTTVGSYAFSGCKVLVDLTVGIGVTDIENCAFDLCNSLSDVYYAGTQAQWQQIEIAAGNEYLTSAQLHCLLNYNGWVSEGGTWYYYESGVKATGWRQVDGTWYYFNGSGMMLTGWQLVSGKWYYFNGSGAMQTGWLQLGSTWYYLESSGAMVTGTVFADGALCKFNASGVWQGYVSGWNQVGGKWYYTGSNGKPATGWKSVGGTYYYFNASGVMQTGWLKDGSTWYYLKSSGAMATGWAQVGSTWYYFNGSGAMLTGWQKISNVWYYFQSGGAMQTGWLKDGSTWYYFHSSGAMATGSVKIGNKTYNFNSSGACLNP